MTMGEFWSATTSLVLAFNGRVTSGPRSRQENARLKGVTDSMHITGLAADVVLADWHDKNAFIHVAHRLGILVIDETTTKNHLHLQPANAKPMRTEQTV